MIEDFLKWLDDNEYLKDDDWNYEIITEEYLHSNVMNKIKRIFNSYYHIFNTVVWYDEWKNTYKCTFSANWFKDIDTEVLNEKLNDIKLNIINVKLVKKQQNPYSVTQRNPHSATSLSTTTFYSNRDVYNYTFEIGEFEYDEED